MMVMEVVLRKEEKKNMGCGGLEVVVMGGSYHLLSFTATYNHQKYLHTSSCCQPT